MLLPLLSFPAYATSCAPLNDYFYIACKAGKCEGLFRVREIPGNAGVCSRRPMVEPLPPDILFIIFEQLKKDALSPPSPYMDLPKQLKENALLGQLANGGAPPDGYFVVEFATFGGFRPSPSGAADMTKAFQDENPFRRPFLKNIQEIKAAIDIEPIRHDWETKSARAQRNSYIYWAIQIGILLLFLWPTAITAKRYQGRIRAYFSGKTPRPGVAGYLLAQCGLFALVFLFALFSMDMWLPFLAAPLLLIILLFEFVQFFLYALLRYRKRNKNTA